MAQILNKPSMAAGIVVFTLTIYMLLNYALASNLESESHDINSNSGSAGSVGVPLGSLNDINGRRIFASHRNLRTIYGLGPKMIPIELDLLVENDDGDRSKRFDDYGHMRFGKRGGEEQFDDYGHMRFGRSIQT